MITEVEENRERVYLIQCIRNIEDKLQWGHSKEWNSQEFRELSELINQSTGVVLSVTTLKRIWGRVQYQNAPTLTTLNALAGFAGYKNWREFKKGQKSIESQIANDVKRPPLKVKKYSWVLVSVMALLLAFVFANYNLKNDTHLSKQVLGNIEFTSRPVTKGLPNSVIFDFDLSGVTAENIRIQQYWDENKTITISPTQQTATGIYYFPGYFRAKLLVENEIVKEHDLFIKSEGWMATLDINDIPRYLNTEEFHHYNILGVSEQFKKEVSQMTESNFLTYHLVQPFNNLSGNNFTLKTTMRNTFSDRNAVCQTSKIYILGSEGAMVIPFSIPGCVSSINMMLNDNYLSGKSNDLSYLGTDLKEWTNVKIEVVEKEVKISINDSVRIQQKYDESMGKVVGLRYKFLGAGEVNNIHLSNAEGEDIYTFKSN